MNVVTSESILEIAHLPDLNDNILTLIEGVLLFLNSRDGSVSIQSIINETNNLVSSEIVKSVFFALTQMGTLKREDRDQRGINFDTYNVLSDQLHQIIRDVRTAKLVLERLQDEKQHNSNTQIVATFPENLLTDPKKQSNISSLSSALHRLITESNREVFILNPYFEQVGFDRISSALLASAERGVSVTIVTYQLSDPISPNYIVLKELAYRASINSLSKQFNFVNYQHNIDNRIVPIAHAKIIFIDGLKAYIGSANLTEYGMANNLEIGVILDSPEITKVKQIFEEILTSEEAESVAF